MGIILYNLFLKLYRLGIRLAARNGNKAAKWIDGRRNIFEKIEAVIKDDPAPKLWIHCASLGEFEQGRPVIEALQYSTFKTQNWKVVLTFFSPSGYELRKNYKHADYVFYLPVDGKKNAKHFVDSVNPSLVIFVKYEFWYYYLHTLNERNIPTFLISATFRKSQPFFKWYGNLFRKMLSSYSHLFLQDERSKELLKSIGVENTTVAGDTRYDRVAGIAAQAKDFPLIDEWKKGSNVFIAGSTWPEDEKLLSAAMDDLPDDWKLILAPHEIHEAHLQEVTSRFGDNNVLRYSHLPKAKGNERVLLIDNIGMLSSLYRYGEIAYVGGGFGSGIHNILEPAIYGLPVFFGPNYRRFLEACEMVKHGLAFSIRNVYELKPVLNKLIQNTSYYQSLKKEIHTFMKSHQGATHLILKKLTDCKSFENKS